PPGLDDLFQFNQPLGFGQGDGCRRRFRCWSRSRCNRRGRRRVLGGLSWRLRLRAVGGVAICDFYSPACSRRRIGLSVVGHTPSTFWPATSEAGAVNRALVGVSSAVV